MVNWNIAQAKQKFSELVRAAKGEPQWIYKRDKLVAAVVPPEALRQFMEWKSRRPRPTMAEALAELRRICREEDYSFELPTRRKRPNIFVDALADPRCLTPTF